MLSQQLLNAHQQGSHDALSEPIEGFAISTAGPFCWSGQGVCQYLATSRNSASQLSVAGSGNMRRGVTRNAVAAYRKSVWTHILKPCNATRHLILPSGLRVSTQVVLMGSFSSWHGSDDWQTAVRGAFRKWLVERDFLVHFCVSSASSAGEVGSVAVYS